MYYKWIGALLIVSGCGAAGVALALIHRYQEKSLKEMIRMLDFMVCELHFHMTPLPELCRNASTECQGSAAAVMFALGEELDRLESENASRCMEQVLPQFPDLPEPVKRNLQLLGDNLGRFDLQGQISGLEEVRNAARRDLEFLSTDREQNLRSYQTLGLCAGAALAIILI